MTSPCIKEVSRACFRRCCPTPLLRLPDKESPEQTISPSRYDFIAATASSLPPNAQFTNHESLPDLERSFSAMKKAYPYYPETDRADRIRSHEYYHLSNHVCLDYIGNGLFSYSQQLHSNAPFFNIIYKSVNLYTQITHGGQEQDFESLIKERIFRFMNISSDDYALVFTANQSSAFKVLADNYPFHTNRNLLTVYDHENEAVETMIESCKKRSGRVDSALFAWPNMRVHSKRLRKSVVDKNKKKKKRKGLFVFPLQSKVTGTRYSYLWMSLAQENGWHVCLDANAFGAKDMETLGLSLFQPDFLICSFYKIFGENPSGFGCLFVKKSKSTVLKNSSTSTGLVNIVQASNRPLFLQQSGSLNTGKQEDIAMASSSSSSNSSLSNQETFEIQEIKEKKENENEKKKKKEKGLSFSEIWKHDRSLDMIESRKNEASSSVVSSDTEFRGLDLADSLGLILISSRVRYLVNWLVNAFGSLQHPHSENGVPLVRIYGPKVRVDRGPVLAFNVFDWKGEKVEPTLVQKLADRYNISLSYATLKHVCFVDKSREEREILIENEGRNSPMNKRKEKIEVGIPVIMATVGFLTNFEDVYRVWVFVSRFLDADFVEKERWRYMALNRTTVEEFIFPNTMSYTFLSRKTDIHHKLKGADLYTTPFCHTQQNLLKRLSYPSIFYNCPPSPENTFNVVSVPKKPTIVRSSSLRQLPAPSFFLSSPFTVGVVPSRHRHSTGRRRLSAAPASSPLHRCLHCEDPGYNFMYQATTAPPVSYYDYIIVGGGTAGCPLATTLSQNFSVLLLERGSRQDKHVILQCDRSGSYRDIRGISGKRKKSTSTRLIKCPFKILGKNHGPDGGWIVDIKDLSHKHEPSIDISGHPSFRQLTPESIKTVEEMTKAGIPPRQILSSLRQQTPNLPAISRTIYNVKRKIKRQSLGDRVGDFSVTRYFCVIETNM